MYEKDTIKPDTQWIDSILTVHFDLEEGQIVDMCHPSNRYPEKLLKLIGYFSFPDSYVLTNEGDLFYCYQMKFENEPLYCYSLFTQKKDPKNARGYYQKSIVLTSKNRLVKIFRVIMKDLGRMFFSDTPPANLFEVFLESLNKNPEPAKIIKSGLNFTLKIVDSNLKVQFKRVLHPMLGVFKRYSIF